MDDQCKTCGEGQGDAGIPPAIQAAHPIGKVVPNTGGEVFARPWVPGSPIIQPYPRPAKISPHLGGAMTEKAEQVAFVKQSLEGHDGMVETMPGSPIAPWLGGGHAGSVEAQVAPYLIPPWGTNSVADRIADPSALIQRMLAPIEASGFFLTDLDELIEPIIREIWIFLIRLLGYDFIWTGPPPGIDVLKEIYEKALEKAKNAEDRGVWVDFLEGWAVGRDVNGRCTGSA